MASTGLINILHWVIILLNPQEMLCSMVKQHLLENVCIFHTYLKAYKLF